MPKRFVRGKATMRVSVRLAQNGVVVMSRICSRATSESRAGHSVPHRTATVVCHSTARTVGRQGVSLVVAARPTAGRSPARACNAMRQQWRYRLSTFSSGTTAGRETRCLFALCSASSNRCCFGSALRLRWRSDAVKGKDVAVQRSLRMVRPRAKGWQSKHGT
jgi:hypothetical protein